MALSVIIPVKNEEEIILNTLKKLENSWLTNIEHEVLIINDNSSDETVNLIKNNKFNKINIEQIYRASVSSQRQRLRICFQ